MQQHPVPICPRGPPRKPRHSDHALWVGSLPATANISELKDLFSRGATSEITSVFLIAKSNCAFVNYRTEAACKAAAARFHNCRLHGQLLNCRLRRGGSGSSSTAGSDKSLTTSSSVGSIASSVEDTASPVIVRTSEASPPLSESEQVSESSTQTRRVPEKIFVLKSLTMQDLQASVGTGTWATQPCNEDALNRAFNEADNVYLIFSANKSGEYFGYARMISAISGDAPTAETPTEKTTSDDISTRTIPTEATATAPRGMIVDDTARGTIFWEASYDSNSSDSSSQSDTSEQSTESTSGRPFQVQWISTNRVPFYRTRGLRNALNLNREVKIARDGTEIEQSVGKQVLSMFGAAQPLLS